MLEFSHDWYSQPQAIMELVTQGLHYKTALRKALFTFAQGVSNGEIKGSSRLSGEGGLDFQEKVF